VSPPTSERETTRALIPGPDSSPSQAVSLSKEYPGTLANVIAVQERLSRPCPADVEAALVARLREAA